MQHTLVAVFDDRNDAQNAKDALLSSGFSRSDVTVSSADADATANGAGTARPASAPGSQDEGIGASIKHFFSDLFGSDDDSDATRYSDAVSRGSHVLTVTAASESEVERAAELVERFGPVDLDAGDREGGTPTPSGSAYRPAASAASASTASAASMQSATGKGSRSGPRSDMQATAQSGSMQRDTGIRSEGEVAIPVVQEELKVGKRQVERGGVRVFSRIVETPVDQSIGLREEHVSVERRPVDKPVAGTDAAAFKEQSIELREHAEEAVVQKSARVVEEVVVGKEVSQHEQNIHDTVRHTEVSVENLKGSDLDDTYYRNDWQSNYGAQGGSYDDYAPAYRYGNEMRGDSRYSGRAWNDVESDLRSDWDARNTRGGASTWESMKAAVRSGWDRMTS